MLNKFNNNFQNKPFHSHGFAHAANSDGIGAVSPETFAQRQHVHKNRRHVGGYKDSLIANTHLRPITVRTDGVATAADGSARSDPQAQDSRTVSRDFSVRSRSYQARQRTIDGISPVATPPAQHHFTEPRHRYNPYQ